MGVYRDRGKWYIDYYFEGRRIREAVGTSKRAARRALAARRGEIVQGRFKLEEVRPSPLFERVAEQYATWAAENKRGWRRSDRFKSRALLDAFRGKSLRAITPWLIEKYKLGRREQVKPATVNRELSLLSHLLTKAIEWDHASEHPMKGGKVKKLPGESQRERIITPAEERTLLEKASARLRPVLILAVDTGMRLGEILGLTWDRVDLHEGEVLLVSTKNGRPRRVPLTARAREALRALRPAAPGEGLVFTKRSGRPMRDVRGTFHAATDAAKLAGLRFHDLRHTCATRLVLGGVDIVTVQRWLGHLTLAMTQRYAHPRSEDMRRAVRVLEQAIGSSQRIASMARARAARQAVSSG